MYDLYICNRERIYVLAFKIRQRRLILHLRFRYVKQNSLRTFTFAGHTPKYNAIIIEYICACG